MLYVIVFLVGLLIGVAMTSCLIVSKDADERAEKMRIENNDSENVYITLIEMEMLNR